jgi:hypothetical protein
MSMHSIISWGMIFALGLIGVVAGVSAREPVAVLLATGIVSLLAALVGIRERRALLLAGVSRSAVESLTGRYMGIVWLWGAAAIFTVYAFLLSWREWPHFFAGFTLAGLLSLGYAMLLARDAAEGRDDDTILTLGRYLCIGQLAGMVVAVIGLAIDPDKEFVFIKESDWAGNSIFLLGALALVLLSAHALSAPAKRPL